MKDIQGLIRLVAATGLNGEERSENGPVCDRRYNSGMSSPLLLFDETGGFRFKNGGESGARRKIDLTGKSDRSVLRAGLAARD